MAKSPEFYRNYVFALFRRGKKDRLPEHYILEQSNKVLKDEERILFAKALQALVDEGRLSRNADDYELVATDP